MTLLLGQPAAKSIRCCCLDCNTNGAGNVYIARHIKEASVLLEQAGQEAFLREQLGHGNFYSPQKHKKDLLTALFQVREAEKLAAQAARDGKD